MRRAHRAWSDPAGERDRRLPVGLDDAGLEQRGLDHLAPAGLEAMGVGGEDAHGREDAAGDVGEWCPALDRRPARALAGDAHDPAHRLRDQIEAAAMAVGSGPAKAGERAVDQARIALAQLLVVEAELRERARPVVLDHDVGILEQARQHPLAARGLEVEHDAPLVAVDHHERGRLAVDHRQPAPGVVAARDLLDLDHVGAHVGQHQRAGRPRHDVCQIDHLEAGKRSHRSSPPPPGLGFRL